MAELLVALAEDDAPAGARAAAAFREAGARLSSDWEPAAFGSIVAARAGDDAAVRQAIDRLAQESQFQSTVGMRRALEGLLLAASGRREAATALREGLALLRRVGHILLVLLVDLEIVARLDPSDPLAAEAADEVRAFSQRTGANAFLEQLATREAIAARRAMAAAPASTSAARQEARVPENTLTTS
jgi:hypothetical protein